MVEGIIYKYTSPSGKCYIGQTTNEKIRREHWNTEGPYAGRKIDRARKKYGIENFTYEVLERKLYYTKWLAKQELDHLEMYYIGLYDSYRNGYNCTLGGSTTLGFTHSCLSKKKMSAAKIGGRLSEATKAKLSNRFKGRTINSRWREKISASLKGKKKPLSTIKKISESKTRCIVQYDIDGRYVNGYHSTKVASEFTHISMCAIYKCLSGKNKTAGGFIWKYKD